MFEEVVWVNKSDIIIDLDRAKLEGLCSNTAHELLQRATCHNGGVQCNNTYQISYAGNSDLAMYGLELGLLSFLAGSTTVQYQ